MSRFDAETTTTRRRRRIPKWKMASLLAVLLGTIGLGASSVLAASGGFSTYLGNPGRTGFNGAETAITPANASKLKLHWIHHAGGSVSNQPVEANGLIYWGTWDGAQQAAHLNGSTAWTRYVGRTVDGACDPTSAGPASTPTVVGSTLYVGGGNAHFYALNAFNGQIRWQRALGSSPSHFIWSSPAVYNGSVYIGISSFGDCPLVQGQLYQLNAATGAIQHVFNVVPNGCTGGGIWSAPAIDVSAGTVYVTTGNAGACRASQPYTESIVELRASNLSVVGFWHAPRGTFDNDFGTTPTIFGGLVGAANKSGVFYALRRGALSRGPVWARGVAAAGGCPQCDSGTISSAAYDGGSLYVAGSVTTIRGVRCAGSLRALNPNNGAVRWELCLQSGPVLAAVTAVRGLAIVDAGATMYVVSSASGRVLFSYHDPSNRPFWGPASVSNGVIYQGNMDGSLFAFGR